MDNSITTNVSVRQVVEGLIFNGERSQPGFVPRDRAHSFFNWVVLGKNISSDQNSFLSLGLNENRMQILHVPRDELAVSGARTCNKQFDAANGETIVRFGTHST